MTAPSSWQVRRRARQSLPAVAVHIDALVLHGVAHADAATLTAALSDEFARLATQSARLSPLRAEHLLAAPYTGDGPREIGHAVAASLWAGVRQQGGGR